MKISFLSGSVVSLVDNLKKNLEDDLKKMIDDADLKYENILISELNEESKEEKGMMLCLRA